MKKITLAQAIDLQKKATTPELLAELIQALLATVEAYEQAPDLSTEMDTLKGQLQQALKEKQAAEEIAKDAMEAVNKTLAALPKETFATHEKKKYKILFGVDGMSKEEIAKDKTKLARLVEIKSGAIQLQEDK